MNPPKQALRRDTVYELAKTISALPNTKLRGLMAIPSPETDLDRQRQVFRMLRELLDETNRALDLEMDCLSMGMTDDMEAAVAEGANPRAYRNRNFWRTPEAFGGLAHDSQINWLYWRWQYG